MTDSFFHTQKEHKNWYEPNVMGKQRGKPRYDLKEIKKTAYKGMRKK